MSVSSSSDGFEAEEQSPCNSTSDTEKSEVTQEKPKRRTKRTRVRSPETVVKLKRFRRSKANNRERSRMHSLNDALDTLRTMLPQSTDDTKLTKIETLRYAYNYIFALSETLKVLKKQEDGEETPDLNSPNLRNDFTSMPSLLPSSYFQPHQNALPQQEMHSYKPESNWPTTTTPTCSLYNSQPRSQDSYDFYSEGSCSPQSSCPSEWNPVFSTDEESPMKYSSYTEPMRRVVYDIAGALSHCQ